jgi:hypothetical protein
MEQLGQTMNNIVHVERVASQAQNQQQQQSTTSQQKQQQNRMAKSQSFTAPSTPGAGAQQFKPTDISYKSTPARNIRTTSGGNQDTAANILLQSASFLSTSSFSSIAASSLTRTEFLISQSLNSRHSQLSSVNSITDVDDEDARQRASNAAGAKKRPRSKLELLVDILFKFEQLEINFLAEVDKPLKEIGALCFNDYELTINKNEPHLTVLKMKLKSLSLSDKLTTQSDDLVKTSPPPVSYLLWSDAETAATSTNNRHVCAAHMSGQQTSRHSMHGGDSGTGNWNANLTKSYSHENLNFTHKVRKHHQKSKHHHHNRNHHHHHHHHRNDFINNMFELTQYYGQLSTSLPSELSDSFGVSGGSGGDKSKRKTATSQRKRSVDRIESTPTVTTAAVSSTACPSTPPPSPTFGKQGSFFARSESMSSILKQDAHLIEDNGGEDDDGLFDDDDNVNNFSFGVSDPIEMRNRHNSKTHGRRGSPAVVAAARRNSRKKVNKSELSPLASSEPKREQQRCAVCESEANPLVKINVIMVDEKHAAFASKYKNISRFLNIKFSSLKLNVIPETWILLLDLLGRFFLNIYI